MAKYSFVAYLFYPNFIKSSYFGGFVLNNNFLVKTQNPKCIGVKKIKSQALGAGTVSEKHKCKQHKPNYSQ